MCWQKGLYTKNLAVHALLPFIVLVKKKDGTIRFWIVAPFLEVTLAIHQYWWQISNWSTYSSVAFNQHRRRFNKLSFVICWRKESYKNLAVHGHLPLFWLRKKKLLYTRFCVDYWKVNTFTRKDAYPLLKIDETLDTLSGSQLHVFNTWSSLSWLFVCGSCWNWSCPVPVWWWLKRTCCGIC